MRRIDIFFYFLSQWFIEMCEYFSYRKEQESENKLNLAKKKRKYIKLYPKSKNRNVCGEHGSSGNLWCNQ